ncbi:MAG: PEP-CTERM sorting domain-containing protein, partial [Planctomycetota bacterium]|nr:PEP-CTERM sorting domain-containing protein [Planctomycetota bacterium]
ANVGADDTIVHSGALALSSSDTGPLAGPKDFDIVIALSTPFFYDPSAGNLLLDVRNFVGASTSIGFFDATGSASDSTSRVYSVGGVNNVTALNNNTAGLVTQFDIAPIPEPGSVVLVATGLGCMAFWRRGRRRRVRRSRAV